VTTWSRWSSRLNAAFEGVDVGSLTEDQIRDILLDHVVDGDYTRSELSQLGITRSTLVTKGRFASSERAQGGPLAALPAC